MNDLHLVCHLKEPGLVPYDGNPRAGEQAVVWWCGGGVVRMIDGIHCVDCASFLASRMAMIRSEELSPARQVVVEPPELTDGVLLLLVMMGCGVAVARRDPC